MQNVAPGAAFVRSTVPGDQSRAKDLFGQIGERWGLAQTAPHVYDLLATPQTLETLHRAIAHDSEAQHSTAPADLLASFVAELYRRDLIELSADS